MNILRPPIFNLFPLRRSSDLVGSASWTPLPALPGRRPARGGDHSAVAHEGDAVPSAGSAIRTAVRAGYTEVARAVVGRSEEHTSELQSHSDLVCRLLLEKKII